MPLTVELNQIFSPYPDAAPTFFHFVRPGLREYKYDVRLVVPFSKANLGVEFAAFPEEFDLSSVLTPFNPGFGYQVSPEDFNPRSRRNKLERLKSAVGSYRKQSPTLAEYRLTAITQADRDLYMDDESSTKFVPLPEVSSFLDQLRLQFLFPNSVLESSGVGYEDDAGFEDALAIVLLYSNFYPPETGPLPDAEGSKESSLFIQVSEDKLTDVRAKFVLSEPNI